MFAEIFSDIPSGILSNILYISIWHSMWHLISLNEILHDVLFEILSDIIWQFIWHRERFGLWVQRCRHSGLTKNPETLGCGKRLAGHQAGCSVRIFEDTPSGGGFWSWVCWVLWVKRHEMSGEYSSYSRTTTGWAFHLSCSTWPAKILPNRLYSFEVETINLRNYYWITVFILYVKPAHLWIYHWCISATDNIMD